MIVSPTATDLDYQSLVNWDDQLTQGLVYWHLSLPGRWGGVRAYDLVSGLVATRTNMGSPPTSTSGQGTTTRPGGWGEERFDGADDYVNAGVTGGNLLATNNFTISMCFKPTITMPDLAGLLSKNQSGPYPFTLRNESGSLQFATNDNSLQSGVVPTAGQWYHVTIKMSAAAGKTIYVDGVEKASNGYTTAPDNNGNVLYIGLDYQPGNSRNFNGAIDNICVYRRALSAQEVMALYADSRHFHPRMVRWAEVPMHGSAAGGFAQSLGGTLVSSGAIPRAINKALVGAV